MVGQHPFLRGTQLFILAYFDDLLVYSETIDLYEQHLPWIFAYLHSEKLFTGHAKYVFGQTQVDHLDHIVGGGVIAVDSAKTHAIRDWPEPTCVKNVQQFLVR